MIDLHIHSHYSDGTNSLDELVDILKSKNITTFSLTDHDTVRGIIPMIQKSKKYDMTIVPGVEISSSIDDEILHILGYNIDYNNNQLKDFLSRMTSMFTDLTYKKLDMLNKKGLLNYSWDNVIKHCNFKSAIYSSDVYKSMIKDGYPYKLKDWPKFYKNTFSHVSQYFPRIVFPSPEECIEIILHSGGLPVLAHPKRYGNKDILFIKKLIPVGLKGIEVYYPFHDSNTTKQYYDIANEYNLIKTGGTDWHGELTTWDVEIGDYGVERLDF